MSRNEAIATWKGSWIGGKKALNRTSLQSPALELNEERRQCRVEDHAAVSLGPNDALFAERAIPFQVGEGDRPPGGAIEAGQHRPGDSLAPVALVK